MGGRNKGMTGIVCAALLCLCLISSLGSNVAAAVPDGIALTAKEKAQRANVPEGLWILISIHEKSLTLYEGTEVVKRYVVATGAGDTPTPIGTYRITHRFSGDLGGFGTRFLGLNVPWGQFGIHGTNKPGSIGSNASHGCIRMHVKDSEELYAKVPNGTVVVIEGGPYGLLDYTLRPLQMGDRNGHVAAVQRRLSALGYHYGTADGIYGRGTAQAVQAARKALGLRASDDVDYGFYKAIGLILFE